MVRLSYHLREVIKMPKRKSLPAIGYQNLGANSASHVIQKSNPLLTLSETNLTLPEFKILDAYLARINSHNPEKRLVEFEKGMIERCLDVTQIKSHDLEKRIDNLFQVVTIRDQDKIEGFTKIALFEKARCYQDKDGLWKVELSCSQAAMEYVFNIENIGYLRYRLKNVVNLTSRYSYVLYLYLEQHRKMHLQWEVEVDELKSILRCTAETYKSYYRFNDLILRKCHTEITQKTQCEFSYTSIRKGRSVKRIHFSLKSNASTPEFVEVEEKAFEQESDITDLFREACCPYGTSESEFNRTEIQEIIAVLVNVPEHLLPSNAASDSLDIRRYHYLAEKYAKMRRISEREKIRNRVSYLVSMIKSDCGR